MATSRDLRRLGSGATVEPSPNLAGPRAAESPIHDSIRSAIPRRPGPETLAWDQGFQDEGAFCNIVHRANALKSTGPKTEEGKARSRANAYKHGLAGVGVVLPEREADEVDRRYAAYLAELNPSGEIGRNLARRAATLSVRMERCVNRENAELTDRVRSALAEYQAPEGVDAEFAAKHREEAGRRAAFDPSPEATLARRYEAAAERGFFKVMKELRQVERAVKVEVQEAHFQAAMASFGAFNPFDAELDAIERRMDGPTPPKRPSEPLGAAPTAFELPFSIGRRC